MTSCYTDVHQARGNFGLPYPLRLGRRTRPVRSSRWGPLSHRGRSSDRVGVPWVQSSCGRCECGALRGLPQNCPERRAGRRSTCPAATRDICWLYADADHADPRRRVVRAGRARIFCAGYTVYSGLRIAQPQPQPSASPLSESAGLGHLALQYAHAAGFRHDPRSRVHTIRPNSRRDSAPTTWSRTVAKSWRTAAAPTCFCSRDFRATRTRRWLQAIDALRPDGRLVVMGVEGGAEKFSLTPSHLLNKRI